MALTLRFSATSPYVRKVVIVAHELDLFDKLELVNTAASPVDLKDTNGLVKDNPLSKIPSLNTPDGHLYDSPVIVEYLDSLSNGRKVIPVSGSARWKALRQQAEADGILDAALLSRYENFLRPEQYRWTEWVDGQLNKIKNALIHLESEAEQLAVDSTITIGEITIASALGYLDFRDVYNWRPIAPKLANWYSTFSARESFQKTIPPK
ncbi:glutathione S-transferase domain-containing protein [Gonapodya prolifera JEL478]|uniref:Glutathione S-transferase domain-containing protein n=1 Tax=Gonapodya prolifera (strain JEL478) TaxID=1344416 RepID=A0A139AVP4_GONPJ|nr:glutathione S-transferase domain-containing protein [Gonapodya prolifera JEL478]|eukprot:KXS20653.1 glutathione S-transferase domain-containing protein [Gonapodya prolifera JEL478]